VSKLIGRAQPKEPTIVSGTNDKIQKLKKRLSQEQINSAVRRYHHILKTLNMENFQVNMENEEFYMTIFLQSLLEENIANIKAI